MKQNEGKTRLKIMGNVIENVGVVIGYIIYIIVYLLFYINQIEVIDYYKGSFSLLDCYVIMMSPMIYMTMMVFPLIVAFSFSTKHDFMAVRITKYSSWKQLLMMQEKKIIVYSTIYSLVFMVVVGVVGWFHVDSVFNWNIEQSYFNMKTGIITDMEFIEILLFFYCVCVIRNIIIQNILLIFLWGKRSIIYGIIAVFIIAFFEMSQPKIRLLLKLFSPEYYIWSRSILRFRMVYGIVIYFLVGIIIFHFITSSKEVC